MTSDAQTELIVEDLITGQRHVLTVPFPREEVIVGLVLRDDIMGWSLDDPYFLCVKVTDSEIIIRVHTECDNLVAVRKAMEGFLSFARPAA